MSVRPSAQQVEKALSRTAQAADVIASKPSWNDYAAEWVLKESPVEKPDGTFEARINGHEAVVRMLQMNEEHYRKQAAYSEARSSEKPRVTMLDSRGRVRRVFEGHAERAEQKGYRTVPTRKPTLRYVGGVWYRRVGNDWVPE